MREWLRKEGREGGRIGGKEVGGLDGRRMGERGRYIHTSIYA